MFEVFWKSLNLRFEDGIKDFEENKARRKNGEIPFFYDYQLNYSN